MSRALQRGNRRVSDGYWVVKEKDEKDGLERGARLSDSIYIPSLLKFWSRRASLVLGDEKSYMKASSKCDFGVEDGVGSDLKDLPVTPNRMEVVVGSGNGGSSVRSKVCSSLWLLKWGLVVIFLLAVGLSFTGVLLVAMTPKKGVNVYRGYRKLHEQVMEDFSDIEVLSLGLAKMKELDFCASEMENYVPCFNVSENPDLFTAEEVEFERDCSSGSKHNCLILPPKDYKVPLRWPAGRDVIWSSNVKITPQEVVSSGSLTKRMMMLEDNQISFRSETLLIDGVEDYSHQIADMIGLQNESYFNQAGIRTVLDIGCGYGSFGAHLFSRDLLTLCVANYELSGSQIQLSLERGLPAMIGSFNLTQLPYPFLSFDMVHCARCGVEWNLKGGALLVEADRVLRPGGFFVWTSPVTNTHRRNKEYLKKWNYIRSFAENLCWELISQQDETALWKKTTNKDCYAARDPGTRPSICTKGRDIEFPYYRPLVPCIGGTQSARWIPIEERVPWPSRARLNSTELSLHGIDKDDFDEDGINWSFTIHNYWSLLSPVIYSDHPKRPGDEDPTPPYNMLRNVMDMNAHFGGFNAALLDSGKTVWVMNVVPVSSPNYLSLILDRGFIGVLHDWCEAFPTYPRSYDLLHADKFLSLRSSSQSRCTLFDIFLEMDRILRPEGWVIFRDKALHIDAARALATQMRWEARVVEIESNREERLLICQKPLGKKQAVLR